MRSLPPPPIDDTDLYDRVARARQAPAGDRVRALRAVVLAAYATYGPDSAAVTALAPVGVGADDADALFGNYERLGLASFREVRAAVLRANGGRCALCLHGDAGEIDHYLPRSVYPEFAIHVRNLVPSCHRCNHTKGAVVGRAGGGASFVHAYLDALPDGAFLHVDVDVGPSVIPRYSVARCPGLGDATYQTLVSHFAALGLAGRFGDLAVQHMGEYAGAWSLLYGREGAQGLARRLAEEAGSARAYHRTPNHWKPALLDALSRNQAFCGGGFAPLVTAEVA